MTKQITHICFDLDDTLYEQITPFKQALLSVKPVQEELLREIYASFRMHSNELFFLHQRKEISFQTMHIKRIQLAMADYGISISDKEAECFQLNYQQGQYAISLSKDTVQLLAYVSSKGVKISMITNGPEEHQRRKIKSLGLQSWIEEKDIFISSAVGISKPDSRIFHMADQSALYVGDSYENDISGATGAGWDVIWLNKYGLPDKSGLADYIVQNDGELLQLIRQLI